MSDIRKYSFACLIALCLIALPAQAQTQNYYNADAQDDAPAAPDDAAPPSHTVVVTSIQKCYAQLGREETLDIEANFIKPYQECQRRLAIKLKKQHQLKAGEQKDSGSATAKEPAAKDSADTKNPDSAPDAQQAAPDSGAGAGGGFYRVQKTPLPPPTPPETKKPDNAGDSKTPPPAYNQ